jgi:glucokinase-like ROK family protein
MRKATQQHTKEHNRNLVLKTISGRESISRAETSRVTSLTRTTVSEIVAELIAEGLVREVGIGRSRGGKSPILLSLVADSRHVIGLDLAYDKFSGAIINLRGEISRLVDEPIPSADGDAALASVYEVLDKLVGLARRPLVGIGVGTPGLVDASRGVVVNAVNLNWKNLPLGQLLQDRYHLPVAVLNDSQAAAVGEHTFGEDHKPESNLIVINVRHGIGAGIIINGQLFHGDGGGAGEIGHVVVVREGGLPCRCGNMGCLETVASTRAVVQRAQMLARHSEMSPLAAAPQDITFERLEQAFAAGDPLARQVVLEAGRFMGMAISSLVGTLNIRKILIAGDITRFGKPFLDSVKDTMSQTTLARLIQDTEVEFDRLDRKEILLGASASILKDYSLLFKRPPKRMKLVS